MTHLYKIEKEVFDSLIKARDVLGRIEYNSLMNKVRKTSQIQYDFSSTEEGYTQLLGMFPQTEKEIT